MLLQTLDVVAVVEMAHVLDEHGFIDAGLLHMEKQRCDRFVFVEAGVAVGVDDDHGGPFLAGYEELQGSNIG